MKRSALIASTILGCLLCSCSQEEIGVPQDHGSLKLTRSSDGSPEDNVRYMRESRVVAESNRRFMIADQAKDMKDYRLTLTMMPEVHRKVDMTLSGIAALLAASLILAALGIVKMLRRARTR